MVRVGGAVCWKVELASSPPRYHGYSGVKAFRPGDRWCDYIYEPKIESSLGTDSGTKFLVESK